MNETPTDRQLAPHSESGQTITTQSLPLDGPIAVSIDRLSELTSIHRTKIYSEIKAGHLPLMKVGKRSVVLVDDARAWLSRGHARTTGNGAAASVDPSPLAVPVGLVWPVRDVAPPVDPTIELTFEVARAALIQISNANPDLGRKGFRATGDSDSDFAIRRHDLLASYGVDAFRSALRVLATCDRRPDIDPGYCSTRCAADVQGHLQSCDGFSASLIEGGHIIAAAIHLAIPVLRPARRSVVLLAVKRLPEGNGRVYRLTNECTREAWAEDWAIDPALVGEPVAEGFEPPPDVHPNGGRRERGGM